MAATGRMIIPAVRRLARTLFDAATTLSLILSAVVLWVRSYRTADQLWNGGYRVGNPTVGSLKENDLCQ
jgi:hypothetical protein